VAELSLDGLGVGALGDQKRGTSVHRFWEIEDEMQKLMQTGFFFRNLIAIATCLVLFGIFAGLGSNLPYTITDPLFGF